MNIIERLKELQAAATPGPWEINYTDVGDEEYIEVPGGITAKNGFRVVSEEGGLCDVQQAWTTEEFESNAELIALSRNNIDALLEVVEAAREWHKAKMVLRESDVDTNAQAATDYYVASDGLSAALAKLEGEV